MPIVQKRSSLAEGGIRNQLTLLEYFKMVVTGLYGSHVPYLPQATTIEGSLFQHGNGEMEKWKVATANRVANLFLMLVHLDTETNVAHIQEAESRDHRRWTFEMEVEITAIYYMINLLTRDAIQLMMQVEFAPPDLLSIS